MGKERTMILYYHGLHDPLTPQSDYRKLKNFAFLMPHKLSVSNWHKFIYFGDIQQRSTAGSALNIRDTEKDDETSISSIF